ncbi:carnitine O-palmitoyltransferase 2, mitochondrial-like [Ischnura elegans]|uniref:carnitine O-palmitoyltransferase 2, mitochondrial-like n=1 Tax=Ischnura elegans TaxID=197161 RepID=UPI001ED8888A|nr:carnitine O-palmitoyltransferase 2, mitochondrial-like [Ischnura elegans]
MALRLRWCLQKPASFVKVQKRYRGGDTAKVLKDKYHYLHKSKIPTLHFQHALARLPIPELKDTAKRYLRALKPIMCPKEYECTEECVTQFVSSAGDGNQLQRLLIEHDAEHPYSNYYCQFWIDMYLSARDPLPVNINPALLIESDSSPGLNCQDVRACNLLISAIRFMKSFQDHHLRPHVLHSDPKMIDSFMFRTVTGLFSAEKSVKGATLFKAFPVDMTQYRSLFNFSRTPHTGKDRLYQNEKARHVVVLRNGIPYMFDVLDSSGNILLPGDIFNCIRYILSLEEDPCIPEIAALTTLNRNCWASIRKRIREISKANAESLQAIDASLFVLCLDDCCERDPPSLLHCILCGNGGNRWFDKSFNLIVNKSGEAGINFEPSCGDGLALIRFINEIYHDSTKNPQCFPDSEATGDAVARVKRLDFCLSTDIIETIRETKCEYERCIQDVQVNTLSHQELGKKYCESNKLSADAIAQLALQLAYYKMSGVCVASYESCSTALFKHGRVEGIRPATMETQEFCINMTSACRPSAKTMRELLNRISETHVKRMKEAAVGQGFDQHLFALRAIAEKRLNTCPLPEIFLDRGYEIINRNIISASRLASPCIQAGTYGPREKEGVGVGYKLLKDSMNMFITNHEDCTCGSDILECINSALNDIYLIIYES